MIATARGETGIQTATSIEVRRRTPADRDALVAMYLSFEPKGVALGLPPRKEPEGWLDGLAGYPNFVARADDRVVGHALLCPAGDLGEVGVFIHQDYRGRGLGKRLLSELIREARRLGLRRVWGMTEIDNVPMLRLAYSLGFVRGKDPREFYLDLDQKIPAGHDEFSAT
jgi:RimJ/RimL family protein N-acetyltransferase